MGIGDEPDVPPPSSARARPPRPRSNKKRSWTWEHFTKKMVIPQYSEKMLRDALAEMIIKDEMPFTTVEKSGFRSFIKLIEPRFPMPSRYTVMRDCMKRHLKEKAEMRQMFVTTDQRVSFMTDTWTSIQNVSYMCITAHYIDSSWTLKKRIIGFKEINDHKGASIGAAMDDCLKDWGIQKRNTRVRADVIQDHEFIHIRCCAHIINLIVTEGLKEVDDSITKVRNIVRYVRASPQRLKKFRAIEEQLGIKHSRTLCLDVPTRWNSTYMMLDVAQRYQKVFERMERMLSKYNKYWGQIEKINRLLFVAVILDPRIKLAVIEYWANFILGAMKAASFITALKTDLDDLYNHYKNSGQPSSLAGTSHVTPTPPSDDFSPTDTLPRRRRNYDIMNEYHQLVASKNIMGCTSEVERYFMEGRGT
ncbi:hypothetical protein I3760_10G134900 [Carya illinoinensis]|nr:hypothetical protein I3760_10G134900 [Carya illinoinensis]